LENDQTNESQLTSTPEEHASSPRQWFHSNRGCSW
jgi:hypothetical protein